MCERRHRYCVIGVLALLLSLWSAGPAAPRQVQAADGHAAAADAAPAEAYPSPLEFKTDLAIWTFVVFVVLFFILRWLAWGPISQALDRREQNIAGNIEAARRTHDEAKELLVQYEKRLAGAADQVREMLEEARRDAEHTKQEIVSEARSAAQAEHERATRDIRTAADAAVKELSEKSADLAIELAGKIVSTKLTTEERSRLVQDSLNKFVAAAPSRN